MNFVFTGLDSRSACTTGWSSWPFEPSRPSAIRVARGFDAPDLDTQALGRTPARDIDSMNGYSAGHLLSCPLVARLPGPGHDTRSQRQVGQHYCQHSRP